MKKRTAVMTATTVITLIALLWAWTPARGYNSTPVSGRGITPRHVPGSTNTSCQEQGYDLEFKIDSGEVGNGEFAFTDGSDSVTISNFTGYIFDWSATLGIDAVIVKDGDDGSNVYEYDPAEEWQKFYDEPYFGEATWDTGLGTPKNADKEISHISFCYDHELQAEKTAEGTFDRDTDWTITKEASGAYSLFAGESVTHDYEVSVTKVVTDTNYRVTGTITIYNPAPFSVNVDVIDTVSDTVNDIPADVTCPNNNTVPSATAEGPGTLQCTYEADEDDGIDGDEELNTATVSVVSADYEIEGATATAPVTFSPTYTGEPDQVTVDDDHDNDTYDQRWQSVSGDTTWNYSAVFECSTDPADYTNGTYTITENNTATIVETGDSDTETVTVECYAPVVTKTADESFTRYWDWTITKDYPGDYDLFAGEIVTHTYAVSVEPTATDNDWRVTGAITVSNPHPTEAMEISSVTDDAGGISAAVDCGGSLTVPADGSLVCTYDTGEQDSENSNPFGDTNTATAAFAGVNWTGTAPIEFPTEPTDEIDPVITVDDDNLDGESWSADRTAEEWTYSRTFECSSQPGDYTEGTYGFDHVNTATINETGDDDSETVTVDCYVPIVDKDADTEWVEDYTWAITKSVDPASHSGSPGDVFTSTYTVSVDQTVTPSGFQAFGTISVTNPNPTVAMTVGVQDVINDDISASVDCGDGTGQLTVDPGQTGTCDYTANLPDATDRTNTATATLNGIGFTATADVIFGDPIVEGFETIDVIDYFDGDSEGQALGSASGDLTFDLYNRTFECPTDESLYEDGVYTRSFPNFAEIDETEQQDDANVDVICTLEQGRIIVEKVTVPSGAEQSFEFDASWSDTSFFLGDGESEDSGPVAPGTYSVSETVPEGWELTSAVCSDESDPSNINLGSGETVTCTFTNTGQPSYTFQKYINGEDADTLEDAVDVQEGDSLTFTYMVTNTGNIAITWTGLNDDVFGDLTADCELPIVVGVGQSTSCDYVSAADDHEQGKENIGTASVEGLDDQTDPAWYKTSAPTPVTLLYFRAQRTDSAIQVAWATAAEINMAGYHVYRGESDGFDAAEPIAFRIAKGSDSTYEVLDQDVEADKTYWYWLASVENDGSQELEGPIKASFASN